MRMARLVSVTRPMRRGGSPHRDEPSPSGLALAHAPAAVPRPGNGSLRASVDPPARLEGLLGHGEDPRGFSQVSRHLQHGAVAVLSARRIRQRSLPRAWFDLAFRDAEQLTREEKTEIL